MTHYTFPDGERIKIGTLILEHNGDPYGGGFWASEVTRFGLVHRGDKGAMSRASWRAYARRNGYQLREYRG